MEVTGLSGVGIGGEAQLLITGAAGEQPLIMSAEDAAQLLAQAGLQLADLGDSERIIIEGARHPGHQGHGGHQDGEVGLIDANGEPLLSGSAIDVTGDGGDINDGAVLYIDPTDPQASALLQQVGLTLAEDGTVHSIEDAPVKLEGYENGGNGELGSELFLQSDIHQAGDQVKEEMDHLEQDPEELPQDYMDAPMLHESQDQVAEEPEPIPPEPQPQAQPASRAQTTTVPASSIQVGPDQQQVFYTVTGEDGKSQQYMMLCPKEMDQTTLIQTLVRQITSDPSSRGRKTIRITQTKKTVSSTAKPPRVTPGPKVTAIPRGRKPASTTPARPFQPPQAVQASPNVGRKVEQPLPPPVVEQPQEGQVLDTEAGNFESLPAEAAYLAQEQIQPADHGGLELSESISEDSRVIVQCSYCTNFRSSLTNETWETILNHILPIRREELQTTFYGDLNKHFIKSSRIQINAKQPSRFESLSDQPSTHCELSLTHSLVCRKTKREFIILNPDAAFIANLAKHIRMTQPGHVGRGNSLLCIFCNSPFTYEDYLRHIQPNIDAILATLHCFAGAYCTNSYEVLRARQTCLSCSEQECADLRFLPCSKFSTEYHCLGRLQFGIDCFRENYGDNGFLRLNANTLTKCSVCKNPQQVYCVVFHVTSTVLTEGLQNVDSQIAVCVNCQKQFINIVMKEQGFEDRLKTIQLRNMEQLCSCLRVVLNQAKAICQEKRVLIYSVHENTSNANSTVHTVKGSEIADLTTNRLAALPENEIVTSPIKAFFVCDLCMFTVDLTSMVATPTNRQKNEMLLSIIQEHVSPHTDSLMAVIASASNVRTFNLKFEVSSNVTEIANTSQRKIVLSLRKKFQSMVGSSVVEIFIDKDEETTINAVRNAVKTERKTYISRPARGPPGSAEAAELPPSLTTTTAMANTQQIEVNKFVDKYRSRFKLWSSCGCNTTLLNSYTECKLCGKYGFPDFRLVATGIEMCESCVETVLSLCLPTDPEVLDVAEECLALREEKSIGHRLVLASDLKKWLSLDGVQLLQKTVEEFDRNKSAECATAFSDGIRQHLLAALKTCQNDPDITTAVAGFCITDEFISASVNSSSGPDSETAAALASLQEQIGVSIKPVEERRPRERQIEVKILSRRPLSSTKKTPIPLRVGAKITNFKRVIRNGTVIDLGSSPSSSENDGRVGKDDDENSAEESVSAIRSFLEETSPDKSTTTIIDGKEVKVPAGIKITSAGKGVVNIRAITDMRTTIGASGPIRSPIASGTVIQGQKAVASVRGMKNVSMVTVTAGGIVKKEVESDLKSSARFDDFADESDEEDEFDGFDDFEEKLVSRSGKRKPGRPKAGVLPEDDDDYKPPSTKSKLTPKAQPVKSDTELADSSSPKSQHDQSTASMLDDSVASNNSEEPRSKRARKEKKIFDL